MQSRKKPTRKSAPARKSKPAGKAAKSITARELKRALEYIEGPIHMILLGVERMPDTKVIKRRPRKGGVFDTLRRLEALEHSNRVSAWRSYEPAGPGTSGPVPLPADPSCKGLLGGPPLRPGLNAGDVGRALEIIEAWIAECRSVIGGLGRSYPI